MADDKQRYLPILGHGENLIEPVKPGTGFGSVSYPRTYEEARTRIKQQVMTLRNTISEIPSDKRLEEVVVTFRLNHKFLAKSYTPSTLFRDINVENIGSRRWSYSVEGHDEINYSKMHFVRATLSNHQIRTSFR